MKALIEAGVELPHFDRGKTYLMRVIAFGDKHMARLLVQHSDLAERDDAGHTALYYAIESKHPEIVAMVSEHAGRLSEVDQESLRDFL